MSAAAVVEQSVAVFEQSIAAFALHALWQLPLLASAAWRAACIGRPQARIAHVLWVSTLFLCVAMPVCSTILARRAALAAERASQVSISYDASSFQSALPPMQRQPVWKRTLHRHLNTRDGLQPFAVAMPQRWARIITYAWLLVIAFFAAQLSMGWVRVRALVRGASADPMPCPVTTALRQQCERLHLPVPAAKLHDGIAGPVLAGVFRPTLLLPAASTADMSPAEIGAVLAHELAHLRRHDPVVHAACSLLLLPVGFHPAALWISRCVRRTREMACDAEAAERMGSPADYAWALLQVAERTSTEKGHAAAAGFFSNGLFGAGLQLFTNRGAMEERMQMLMNGSRVRGRAVRVAAGVSLATVAVLAAGMLQIQPTLAAERSLPQAAAAAQQMSAQAASAATVQESEPALIGGEHAREQLRRAHRQLVQAESQATSAEDRRKIEGAQQAIAAAEQALAAADGSSGPRVHVDLSGLDHLDVQLNALNLPDRAALQAGMAKLQAQWNSPEWHAQMQHLQTEAIEAAHAYRNSPEFKAQMDKQREAMRKFQAQMSSPEFKSQMEAARKLDRTKIEAIMADARRQQAEAMKQFRSGAMQRQIDEARLLARVEPAPMPMLAAPAVAPAPLPAPATAAQPAKPLQIKPGAIKILTKVDPAYPPEAKAAGTQGAVLLHVLIDEKGRVEELRVEKENAPDTSLAKAAFDAVWQWTFQPYLLNGNPIPVETTITVNFSLAP